MRMLFLMFLLLSIYHFVSSHELQTLINVLVHHVFGFIGPSFGLYSLPIMHYAFMVSVL